MGGLNETTGPVGEVIIYEAGGTFTDLDYTVDIRAEDQAVNAWNDFTIVFGYRDLDHYYYIAVCGGDVPVLNNFVRWDREEMEADATTMYKKEPHRGAPIGVEYGRGGLRDPSDPEFVPEFPSLGFNEGLLSGVGSVYHRYRIVVKGTQMQFFMDGELRAEANDPKYQGGMVGVGSLNDQVWFDNFKISRAPVVPVQKDSWGGIKFRFF